MEKLRFSQNLLFYPMISAAAGATILVVTGFVSDIPILIYLFSPIILLPIIFDLGIEIDPEKHKVREYFRITFIKFGKWVPLDPYIDARMHQIKGKRDLVGSQTHMTTSTYNDQEYHIYIYGKNKRRKIYITRFSSIEKARKLRNKLREIVQSRRLEDLQGNLI